MANTEDKLKKGARLLSNKKKGTLRPDSHIEKKSHTTKEITKISSDKKEHSLRPQKTDHTKKPKEKKKEVSPAKKAFDKSHEKSKSGAKHIGKKATAVNAHTKTSHEAAPVGGAAHIVTGVLIATLLIATAYFWADLPFNKGKIITSDQTKVRDVVSATINDFGDDDEDFFAESGIATDDPVSDGEGFAVIENEESDGAEEEFLVAVDEGVLGDEALTVTSTPSEEGAIASGLGQDLDVDAPVVQVNETPTTFIATPEPVRTSGNWSLLYFNTEEFDVDDEDDDVTSLYLKDVCKSIFKQNPNVVSFCKKSSSLKRSNADTKGADKCDGGGSCRIGQTCLLWNDDEEDDGDRESYTAMYRCE